MLQEEPLKAEVVELVGDLTENMKRKYKVYRCTLEKN